MEAPFVPIQIKVKTLPIEPRNIQTETIQRPPNWVGAKPGSTMHSYAAFPDDVINAFDQIIKAHDFKIKSRDTHGVLLENHHCWIAFDMDRYDLQVKIVQKHHCPIRTFDVFSLINHLNPGWRDTEEGKSLKYHGVHGCRVDESLMWYAKCIQKYLKTVLDGDFSWSEQLFRQSNSNIEFIDFIYANLNEENEIRKMYEAGDGNWEPKLRAYLKSKNITSK
jgi:hypothetical protein